MQAIEHDGGARPKGGAAFALEQTMADLAVSVPAFPLIVGEIIHIGGIPYRYVGDGNLQGGTSPFFARSIRDGLPPGEGDSSDTLGG